MNAIADTITLLEQEIEAIDQRRGEIVRAIDTLRPLAGDAPSTNGKTALKHRPTDRPTDRPSKARANMTPRGGLPDDKGVAILAMLKKHGGVMKPRDLAAALKLGSVTSLRYQLKPLVKAKQVVVTGTTMSRRVALPGKSAKEEP